LIVRKLLTTQTAVATIQIRISPVFLITVAASQNVSLGTGLTANRGEPTEKG
jgi:hypothetical protein